MTKRIYKSEVDVAVLLLFFVRTEHTAKTFAQIKKARPSKLFLYQDGPRSEADMENIMKCREIVSDIDWECEVHTSYQEKNSGCDPSNYYAHKWMFSQVDKGIVLEDDDVMAVSFFRFCKELLDKYEHDERINMICGMNNIGVYKECPYDYFFTQAASGWGWASWKRVVDEWDPQYKFKDDKYTNNALRDYMTRTWPKGYYRHLISICNRHLASGREHWETIFGTNTFAQNRLNIVPTRNMTCNIGVGDETTHSAGGLHLLPRITRRLLYMETYEQSFPLKHPKYVVNDTLFIRKLHRAMSGGILNRIFHLSKIEGVIYRAFPAIGRWTLKHCK